MRIHKPLLGLARCSESPNFIPPAAAPLGFYKNKVSLKFQGPSSPVIVWAAWNPGKGMYPKCKGHPVPVSRPQRFRETPAVGKRDVERQGSCSPPASLAPVIPVAANSQGSPIHHVQPAPGPRWGRGKYLGLGRCRAWQCMKVSPKNSQTQQTKHSTPLRSLQTPRSGSLFPPQSTCSHPCVSFSPPLPPLSPFLTPTLEA